MAKIYFNNDIIDSGVIQEIFEPGYLFGWGVFETLRMYKGAVPFLTEHLKRLKAGARFLHLEYPKVEYKKIISKLAQENNIEDAYVRINVFKKRKDTGLIIQVSPFDYYKAEDYNVGAKIIFSSIKRYSEDSFLTIKSISYVKNRIAWLEAQTKHKEEAIFCNEKGKLQEGSRSNIFFVKKGKVFTPSEKCGILPGVTRNIVGGICQKNKIKVIEDEFTKRDLLTADEIFLTSSLMEIMPVSQIENKIFNINKFFLTWDITQKYKQLLTTITR